MGKLVVTARVIRLILHFDGSGQKRVCRAAWKHARTRNRSVLWSVIPDPTDRDESLNNRCLGFCFCFLCHATSADLVGRRIQNKYFFGFWISKTQILENLLIFRWSFQLPAVLCHIHSDKLAVLKWTGSLGLFCLWVCVLWCIVTTKCPWVLNSWCFPLLVCHLHSLNRTNKTPSVSFSFFHHHV